jgi:hypothetical protein
VSTTTAAAFERFKGRQAARGVSMSPASSSLTMKVLIGAEKKSGDLS